MGGYGGGSMATGAGAGAGMGSGYGGGGTPDDSISAAAYTANQDPLVTPTGTVTTPFSADTFAGPWGEAYVPANGQNPAALYVSNTNGTIDRITLSGDSPTGFMQIVENSDINIPSGIMMAQ